MTDEELGELLTAQNEKLERIAVALETMADRNCTAFERIAGALEIAPALAGPSGPLSPPRRPGKT